MRNALKRLAVILGLAFATGQAFAQSTINTSIPAANAPLQSAPMRANFLAAASDVNGILGMHASASLGGCPATTLTGTDCLVTGSNPAVWYKSYPGGWGEIGTFNTSTGQFAPVVSSASLAVNVPLSVVFVPPLATISLNYNATLALDGSNNLGLNLANPNTWTGQQVFTTAPIVSLNAIVPTPFGDNVLALAGLDGGGARVSIFLGSNTTNGNVGGAGNSTAFTGEYLNGTLASPLPIVANNNIVSFGGGGVYCATCVAGGPGWVESRGSFQIWSSNVAWSASSYGTEARIFTTVNNTTTQAPQFTVWNDGGILIGTYSVTAPPYSLDNGPGTLYVNAATQLAAGMSALTVNATNALSPTAKQVAVNFNITGAGTASQVNDAVLITYNAGYTGNKRSIALDIDNLNAGTCAVLVPAAGTGNSCGNMGMAVAALGTTAGYNFGIDSFAAGGAINVGGAFKAQVGASNHLNVGLLASAIGANNNIGIFASLNQTTVPGVSAAGVFDNGTTSSPVALFQVNGVTNVEVDASGNLIAPALSGSESSAGGTLNIYSTLSGSPSGDAIGIRASLIVLRNIGSGTSEVEIGVAGATQGQVVLASPTANAMTIQNAASAAGTATIPSGTYNFVGDSLAQTLTNKTITSSTNSLGSVTAAFGSDAKGDIYTNGGSSNVITRLAIGSTNQCLIVSGGLPAWGSCGAAGDVASLGNYSADSTLTITGTGSGPWTGAVTIKCTVATATQIGCSEPDNTTIKATAGSLAVQYPASGNLMLSAGNGAVPTAYAGTSSAGNVLLSLSAAGAGSFLAYTNANTASTLVERDGSGNFSAGTITASLTGHASLDCALTGCTYSGSVIFADGSTYSSTGLANLLSETIVGGTLAAGAQVLTLTATQPASPVAQQTAVVWTITGAGTASQVNTAIGITYAAGYTGSSNTNGLNVANSNAGTAGALASSGTQSGNTAGIYTANATTAGYNFGVTGRATNANVNIGTSGIANTAKNSGVNVGVMGMGINTGTSPVEIGVWATLGQTTIPSVSAALIADNAGQSTVPIAIFQNGGSQVASIGPTGHILASGTAPTISACGTGTPTISGGDNFGKVVAGTVATSCVINFGSTWGSAPSCNAASGTAIASLTVSATTTQLTITGTALGGDTITWICGSTASLESGDLPANDNLPSWISKAA
jgi:hypothetical protein